MKEIFCGLQHLSLSDFDNHIACVLFTKGCNFNCPFCHNYNLLETNIYPFNDILSFLKERVNKIEAVTITGGEPTLHNELPLYIKQIKDLGYLVKLDSNGTNPTMLKELIDNKLIDYIAMDIKTSLDKYDDICKTSVDINKIKESINLIKNSNIDYEFRTTLINNYHNIDTIKDIGLLLKGSKRYRLQKYVLRESCPDQSLEEVNINVAKEYVKILHEYIEDVSLRNYN